MKKIQEGTQRVLQEIERLREELKQLVNDKDGQFLDPEILQLSQEINGLIVKYQNLCQRKACELKRN